MVPRATRAARTIGLIQGCAGVVLAVVLGAVAISHRPPRDCAMCGIGDIGLLFVAAFTLLASLAIYLPASLALRSQPRGEWTCLLLAEALVPIVIVITDAENNTWPLVRWPSLVVASNLVAIALLLTPAAIRYAWRPPTDPPA